MKHKHPGSAAISSEPPPVPAPPHGGGVLLAARISGLDPDAILDYSVNLNPLGPPPNWLPLLQKHARRLQAYPDPEYTELKAVIAAQRSATPEQIVATNGSMELIYLLPELFSPGQSVLIVDPCFSEYETALRRAGVVTHSLPLNPEADFSIAPETVIAALRRLPAAGGVILGSPNNPTGRLWPREALLALLAHCERDGLYLIIDETFIDFAGAEHSLAAQAVTAERLVLVQSATKFYALPGLRLGWGIASPRVAGRLTACLPPWSVNALAQHLWPEIAHDPEYCAATLACVRREAAFLHAGLSGLPAVEAYPTTANFILFRLRSGAAAAAALQHALLRRGILLRHCANFRGLTPAFFRAAVKTRAANARLLDEIGDLTR